MRAVLDASFMLDFLLPDEQSARVIEAFEKYETGSIDFTSPFILPFEVANGLKSAVAAKRIESGVASRLMGIFLKISIDSEEIDMQKVLNLAFDEKLSVYDASYVLLAKQKGLRLFTLDKRLERLVSLLGE